MDIRQPNKEAKRVAFGSIKPGEVFYCGAVLCMRTLNEGRNSEDKVLNAINLQTGELLVFDEKVDKVAPAEAHVVLGR